MHSSQTNKLKKLKLEIKNYSSAEQAEISQKFFKTGKGEYGEGDKFIGVKVPVLRKIAKDYHHLQPPKLKELITSEIHEERMLAIIILVNQFKKTKNTAIKAKIYRFYKNNIQHVNNWDLVDISAPHIVGAHLREQSISRDILVKLAKSKNLWQRRIAVISTFDFIRHNEFEDTLKISHILLNDKEDLIHKAVGWMLREVSKRDFDIVNSFLLQHHQKMPRTMLRYAIEHYPEKQRLTFLKHPPAN